MISRSWKVNLFIALVLTAFASASLLYVDHVPMWAIYILFFGSGVFLSDTQHCLNITRAEQVIDEKQAMIDELMLEYCPEEMTVDQLMIWGQHQAVVRRIYENA